MAERPSWKVVGLAVGVGLVLLAGAGAIGWAIGDSGSSDTDTAAEAPEGHSGGADLAVAEIGDPEVGRTLYVEKSCANCHMFLGEGGTDGPPLDDMQGHLSATEIANMSGRIWDHLPFMLDAFEEEGLDVPTFTDDEMANLIAYLHSGEGGPPDVSGVEMEHEEEMEHQETGEETTAPG